jgi:nucleoside-diphosphate-sugar epimerase
VSRIAVTGAGGFLGGAVVRRCLAGGATVHALVGPADAAAHALPPEVESCHGQIDAAPVIAALVERCDAVIHLAGPASVAASFDVPAEFARVHVAGTATVLEACRRAGVKRVAYVSSAEVYGLPERQPVDETHRLQARSPYAAAKIGAEQLAESFTIAYGMEITRLRPFSVYGPRQSRGGVVSSILHQLLAGDVVRLAAPELVRDFCFVDDVPDPIVPAATAPRGPAILNVATRSGTSVAALARAAAAAVGRTVEIVPVERRDRPLRADIACLVGDATRLRAELGWRPRTSLVDGLRRTLEWFSTSEAT